MVSRRECLPAACYSLWLQRAPCRPSITALANTPPAECAHPESPEQACATRFVAGVVAGPTTALRRPFPGRERRRDCPARTSRNSVAVV